MLPRSAGCRTGPLAAGRARLASAPGAPRKGRPTVPNVNVTYAEMQAAARQLQAGEQTISGT
jgi:hypothetical protein